MTPLSPEQRQWILRDNPGATQADIDRYETLTMRILDAARQGEDNGRLQMDLQNLLNSRLPNLASSLAAFAERFDETPGDDKNEYESGEPIA